MKTFLCEESVLRHNNRNCLPSYLDHYLKWCEFCFSATFSWTSPLSDRNVAITISTGTGVWIHNFFFWIHTWICFKHNFECAVRKTTVEKINLTYSNGFTGGLVVGGIGVIIESFLPHSVDWPALNITWQTNRWAVCGSGFMSGGQSSTKRTSLSL